MLARESRRRRIVMKLTLYRTDIMFNLGDRTYTPLYTPILIALTCGY